MRRASDTTALRQRAPRFVQFGVTNACNLTCGYCSRDRDLATSWSAESAFDVLAGLADAGVMEVAFGGGEPLAARGFDDLVRRLFEETPLGIGVTTNGTLLDDERITRLAPYVSQFRVSIHDDNDAITTVQRLARHGARFGVNMLVTPQRLAHLETNVLLFAARGCEDFLLLGYTGDDPSLHLTPEGERELERVIARLMNALHGRARFAIDVCFGDRLDVPRLVDHGDCSAGRDGVVLSVDGRVQSCSFQSDGVPFVDAADVVRIWRDERAPLARPSPRAGCARRADHGLGRAPKDAPTPTLPRGWSAYRTFASNNSGSYTLLGRFERVELAASAAERLSRLFKEQSTWDAPAGSVEQPQPLSPYEHFVQEEGLRSSPELYDDDWPDTGALVPTAESFGSEILVHTEYTVSMPRTLGEFLYVRGGRVVTELDHSHHPIVLRATCWPADAPWNDRASIVKSVRARLSTDLPEARLASEGDWGNLELWFEGRDPIALARSVDAFAKRHALGYHLHIEEGATYKDPLRDRRAGAEPV